MTLVNVRDWLQSLDLADRYYIGKLDQKYEKSLGVYAGDHGKHSIAIGGQSNTKTRKKPISLLLHWSKNKDESEKAAQKLFETIITHAPDAKIGDYTADCILIGTNGPVDVDSDQFGVYEYVVNFDIFYQEV